MVANDSVQDIASQKRAVDFLAKTMLDNRIALDYILAGNGGICVVIHSSCCVYTNSSSEAETHLDKIR